MKNKKMKFRIEGAALTALVLAAVILVNVFFSVLGEKTDLKIDLTKGGVFSLADETKELVASVDREIEIYYATNAQNRNNSYQEILEAFTKESDLITVKEVNIDTDPGFANRYQIKGYNNVVVASTDKNGKAKVRVVRKDLIERTASESERISRAVNYLEGYVAAAIRYVTSDDPLTVSVAIGHGEMTENPMCLDFVMEMLYMEGMTVQNVNFATAEVSGDTDVLLFVGPSNDFTDVEIKKLDDFLEKGGRVQYYSNPTKELNNINAYFERNWGVRINNDCVSDSDSGYIASSPERNYLMGVLKEHAMSDYFVSTGTKIRVIEGETNSVEIIEKNEIEANVLVSTSSTGVSMSREAWASKNSRENYKVDKEGELNLLVYLRKNPLFNSETTARLLVAGSCDLILDRFFDSSSDYGNKNLAIKSINYMSGIEDAPISVAAKDVLKEKMEMFEKNELILTITGLVIVIPVIMFILGIVIYVRRRRL